LSDAKGNSFITRSYYKDGGMVQIQVMSVRDSASFKGVTLLHMMRAMVPMQNRNIQCMASAMYSKENGYTKTYAQKGMLPYVAEISVKNGSYALRPYMIFRIKMMMPIAAATAITVIGLI
jgi:hypothetical protein